MNVRRNSGEEEKVSEYNGAMDKIRDELAKQAGNPAVAVLGEYLTARLQAAPGIAGKILDKGKSLAGALARIREAARKKQVQGVGVVSDGEAFTLMEQYFGIPDAPAKPQALADPAEDALDLDALLSR